MLVGPWLLAGVVAAGIVASGAAAAGADTYRAGHVAVPRGWKSYSYGGATISVPRGWAVKHNANCPNTSASGALLLGYPKVLTNCANYQFPLNFVALYQPNPTNTTTATPLTVNGVPVEVLQTSTTFAVWSVPSLGIEITGDGAESARIMHTLRRE